MTNSAVLRNVRKRINHLRNPAWYQDSVGGLWDQMGALQFDFLVAQGLTPSDRMLDVGCGSLRGGKHLISCLDLGNYYGLDLDADLLQVGSKLVEEEGLADKHPTLLLDDAFRFGRFGQTFTVALAQSVFTHLPFNVIMRCLTEMEEVLAPGGRFFATYFQNPGPRLSVDGVRIEKPDGGFWPFTLTIDADPFFYDPDIFRWAVEGSTLDYHLIGDWGHPRKQQMMVFTKRGA